LSVPARLGEAARDALQTAFRMVPWPTEPGLRPVGEPDEWSPVLVTGNYALTVRRVLRALEGQDAWLVVAPSRGINVWCAASGGHLGTPQVVTALKTSGIAERVRHRRAILPQLAATGVRAREVTRRCGWRTRFGPVYAEDLPRYLAADAAKDDSMRHVRFGAHERLEMAAAMGVPMALVLAAGAALLHAAAALPLAGLALALAVAVFAVYERLPGPKPLVFAALAATAATLGAALGGWGIGGLLGAAVAAVVISVLLTYDYPGTTPIEGGSHFEERAWHVELDLERCKGVYSCWEVCPEACFEKPSEEQLASGDRRIVVAHSERCVRCGACIVQCPMDALAFEDEVGARIEPEVIRRFKLNLLGRRSVEADQAGS
jgi:NAD-dependent dihydropyrimidine dehydrogenase PreA subunit